MNSLSWFLYLSSVIPSIGILAFLTAILSFFAVGAYFFLVMGANEDIQERNERYKENKPLYTFKYRWMLVPIIASFISALAPDQKTLYLIAASEAAEVVVTDPRAAELTDNILDTINSSLQSVTRSNNSAETD